MRTQTMKNQWGKWWKIKKMRRTLLEPPFICISEAVSRERACLRVQISLLSCHQLPTRTSSKFQSRTRSLVTARLLTRRGVPGMPRVPAMFDTGVTLNRAVLFAGTFRVKQPTIAPHLPSPSELETEQLLKECVGLSTL